MKKLVLMSAGAVAIASTALLSPAVAVADPNGSNALNVVGQPYARAISILKSQNVKGTFGGSFGSDLPQSACIVSQQKVIPSGKMILMLDCTAKAGEGATDSLPAGGGATSGGKPVTPGAGQGTYGGPIGVPVPVG